MDTVQYINELETLVVFCDPDVTITVVSFCPKCGRQFKKRFMVGKSSVGKWVSVIECKKCRHIYQVSSDGEIFSMFYQRDNQGKLELNQEAVEKRKKILCQPSQVS